MYEDEDNLSTDYASIDRDLSEFDHLFAEHNKLSDEALDRIAQDLEELS
jgi:hypothetical protein